MHPVATSLRILQSYKRVFQPSCPYLHPWRIASEALVTDGIAFDEVVDATTSITVFSKA
jgi:hypothetical protein